MSQFASIKWPFIFLILPLISGGILTLLILFVNHNLFYLSFRFNGFFTYVLIAYGIYPLFFKTEKFFHKIGYANIIFQYQFIKKLLFIILPLLLVYNIFIFGPSSPVYSEPTNFFGYSVTDTFLTYFILVLGVTISSFVNIMIQRGKKEFRFNFAKGCCKIVSEKEDCLEKMRYLRLLLGSYDKYLKRRIKVGIDEKKIYSIILYKNTEERSKIIIQYASH